MNPSDFAYERAGSVQEAITLLAQHGEGAKLIAGGHSLLPIMKLRLAEPERLSTSAASTHCKGCARTATRSSAGALTTHHHVASHELIRARAYRCWRPLLRWSAIGKSATVARSAARSPTPMPPPTIQLPSWLSTRQSWLRAPTANGALPPATSSSIS